jgi:hypothetical protein
MSTSKMDWFFRNSAALFSLPQLLLTLLLGMTLFLPGGGTWFAEALLAWWGYFNLFLFVDAALSLLYGRTGNTLRYVNPLLNEAVPEIAVRGRPYPAGNFGAQIAAKLGLVVVFGVLPIVLFLTW